MMDLSHMGIMIKIKNIKLLLCTVLLTGCVTAERVSLGDGTTAYEIRCAGTARSYADCRNKAAEICGGKYKEIDKDEYNSGIVATGNMLMAARERRMTVVCK